MDSERKRDGRHDQQDDDTENDRVRLNEQHPQCGTAQDRNGVPDMARRQQQRLAVDTPFQFPPGDHRTGKRQTADEDPQNDLDFVNRRVVDHVLTRLGQFDVPDGPQENAETDQHGGQPDEAVQDCHQLRHGRHLNPFGQNGSNRRSEADCRDQQNGDFDRQQFDLEQRCDNRQRHPDDPQHVAAPSRFVLAQSAQTQNKTDAGDQPRDQRYVLHDGKMIKSR